MSEPPETADLGGAPPPALGAPSPENPEQSATEVPDLAETTENETSPTATAETPVDWDTTLEHAKAGYANAQEVVRFVDTKTGVMTGLVSLTTAAPISFFQWSAGLEKTYSSNFLTVFQDHRAGAEILFFGLLFGMALGIGSILCSVHGLMARNPRKKESYQGLWGAIKSAFAWITGDKPEDIAAIKFAYLFPLYLARQEPQAKAFFSQLALGLTKKDVALEHGRQLFQVGRILNIKISQNQKAVSLFKLQVICYAFTVLIAVVLFRYGS